MIASPEELAKLVHELLKNEGFEIWLREIIDRRVHEAITQHLDEYEHQETPLSDSERDS